MRVLVGRMVRWIVRMRGIMMRKRLLVGVSILWWI